MGESLAARSVTLSPCGRGSPRSGGVRGAAGARGEGAHPVRGTSCALIATSSFHSNAMCVKAVAEAFGNCVRPVISWNRLLIVVRYDSGASSFDHTKEFSTITQAKTRVSNVTCNPFGELRKSGPTPRTRHPIQRLPSPICNKYSVECPDRSARACWLGTRPMMSS
jgi:hypothetical protein